MKPQSNREKTISRVIEAEQISTQSALLRHLRRKGIRVTQATLSRDIKKLGIVRVPGPRGSRYQLPFLIEPQFTASELAQRFRNNVTDIKHTANLIVVKTLPGEASGTARLIDGLDLKDVLGTVAGDDTFLIVARNRQSVGGILSFVRRGGRTG